MTWEFEKKISLTMLASTLIALVSSHVAVLAGEESTLRIESVVLRPLRAAEVPALQTGLLQSVTVEEGQVVEQGELLATLDARRAELTLVRAELEFGQAEAKANNEIKILYADKALEVAQAELQRSGESIEQFAKSISQSQMDVERLTVDQLTLGRRQAEHELVLERFGVRLKHVELEAAQLEVSQHQMRAPFPGKVALVRGRVGEWVEVGAPVLRLVAVDKLRAEGFLPAEQASADLVGKPVTLKVRTGEQESLFRGIVRFVSPEMEPVTRQVRVWAEIPNQGDTLRPGQQGTLEIRP